MEDPLATLELLAGDAQTFVSKIWASQVHVHHTDPDRLIGRLSFDDVDHLMTGTAIRTPAVRIAHNGKVLPPSAYTRHATLAGQQMTGLVDPRKVLDLFEDGASIVLQGLHRYWQPLGDMVADLELALGHPCQANAYLTPPGSQGFAVHEDAHDVFVFQTHGSKVWEVHPRAAVEGERQTVVLEPGVSMYLPTGTPHAARAQETASLHVTIGINQITWRHVLERAVRSALDAALAQEPTDEPVLDPVGHLPAGYLDDQEPLRAGLADRLDALSEAVRALDPGELAEQETRRFLSGRTLWQRGGLGDRLAVAGLSDQSRLRRRPGHPCVLRDEGQRLRLLLGDRELTVPARLRPAVETMLALGDFRPADLADHLDEGSRLVLCRRLVREGLLGIEH